MKKQREKEESAPDFDQLLIQLKSMVEKLEGGGLSLDESLNTFEKGIFISRTLFGILEKAEGKVEELLTNMERVSFPKGEDER